MHVSLKEVVMEQIYEKIRNTAGKKEFNVKGPWLSKTMNIY